jgi:hypothetical protein
MDKMSGMCCMDLSVCAACGLQGCNRFSCYITYWWAACIAWRETGTS